MNNGITYSKMSNDLWVAQYYEPSKLSYLPLKQTLKGKGVTFDVLKKTEIDQAFSIVQDGAKYEDNIGINEYEDISTFEDDLKYCQAYSMKENGRFIGSLFIGPSYLTRSLSPCLCQFYIFLNHELFRSGFYAEVAKVAERLAKDLKLRFFVASVLVFGSNAEVITELRRVGYYPSACFPYTGYLKSSGYQQTWLLCKQFDEYIELRHMAEIHKTAETKYQPEPKPLTSDILPSTYYFKCGVTANLRWIRLDELQTFHKLFMQAMKNSYGYGADEYITFGMFLKYQINDSYPMVVEDSKTGDVMAMVSGGQHHRVRGSTPFLASASVLVSPEFRGKGISSELVLLWPSVLKQMGFKYLVGDSAIYNKRMRQAEFKGDFIATGVVPYGLYLAKEGWVDVVMGVKDLTKLDDFSVQVQASYERQKEALRAQAMS